MGVVELRIHLRVFQSTGSNWFSTLVDYVIDKTTTVDTTKTLVFFNVATCFDVVCGRNMWLR
jgi:hypothetical protein